MQQQQAIARPWVALAFWLAGAGAVAADVPMYFFVATTRILYWWAIPLAIILEAVVFRFGFKTTWRLSVAISLALNLASGILGVPLYPVMGFFLYPIAAPFVTGLFGYGILIEAVATLIGLVVLDTCMEILALILLFRYFRVQASVANTFWLSFANLVSTGLLVALIATVPDLPSFDPDRNLPEPLSPEALEPVTLTFAAELQQMQRMGETVWQGDKVEKPVLDPVWIAAQRNEAMSRKFRDLAIVIASGPDRADVEATFLIGGPHGRDPMNWGYGTEIDARGCNDTACFARSVDEHGVTVYYASLSYGAGGYFLQIIATLGELPKT